ncbi:glycosyl hydrolase [Fulvivirgaceae bacterium BMA10]|uniref:Glycosyl hydrolase n=1 Tax=Splendidivirga corallicola TaxID=3051826 RepID=A0ABT8KZR0_9BACT|nr:glycosyl hydrolase [Fulvivirgaceae bacterium BMA10]
MSETSLLKNYHVRSIGPVVQGARITDIDVSSKDINTYYVAYASGGVFKTTNNGVSFKPIFDNQGALTIGDITLAPSDDQIIYVGTGEKNSSRSSYAGSGVYRSDDAGKTWKQIGLDDIQHTSRIIVHPTDPNTVWVASIGSLYSKNKARGVYKSTDGGANWEKTLYISDSTGVIDLVINPQDPNQLWAASWERTRSAWNFKGNGPGSAIYRSDDGGATWKKSMDGFPESQYNGRIGLDIAKSSPNIMYAFLDNQYETKEEKKPDEKSDKLKITDFQNMTKETLLGLNDKKLGEFLKENRYPNKYNSRLVKKDIRTGKYEPKDLANYFGNANNALFNTKIKGAEVYRSEDYGKSWKKVNSYDLEGVYFTYGYYFGEVRISPKNPDVIYIQGVPLLKSTDGGKTYARTDTIGGVHSDQQSMWINPDNPKHILLGNDGGLYVSYDEGAEWEHINNASVGQFYTVNFDMEKPYNVYGGLQDNGTLVGSSRSIPNWTKKWERIFGGDGMYVAPDPRNSDIVFTGFQFGNYYRINRSTGQRKYVTPSHDIGEPKLRYNWRTPIILSKHNADIVYIGAQRLYRSFDQGNNWQAISGDLTKDKPQGNVPYSTISCVSESPLKFGLIYAGTDDGNLQVTKNSGGNWELISTNLPKDLWVSSVMASSHDEGTVFVSLTGYRLDDFRTYVYESNDYGKTWRSLKGDLPDEPINVIIQDPVSPDLLYCGTDHGTYVSFNHGANWNHVTNVPNVASYDMIVHPRENELVIGTHGRSIYVMDVKPLQKLAANNLNKGVMAFKPNDLRYSDRWGERRNPYSKPFDPKVSTLYYVGKESNNLEALILDKDNKEVRRLKANGTPGFHTLDWDVKITDQGTGKRKKGAGPAKMKYAEKGNYKIKFVNGNDTSEVKLEIK